MSAAHAPLISFVLLALTHSSAWCPLIRPQIAGTQHTAPRHAPFVGARASWFVSTLFGVFICFALLGKAVLRVCSTPARSLAVALLCSAASSHWLWNDQLLRRVPQFNLLLFPIGGRLFAFFVAAASVVEPASCPHALSTRGHAYTSSAMKRPVRRRSRLVHASRPDASGLTSHRCRARAQAGVCTAQLVVLLPVDGRARSWRGHVVTDASCLALLLAFFYPMHPLVSPRRTAVRDVPRLPHGAALYHAASYHAAS